MFEEKGTTTCWTAVVTVDVLVVLTSSKKIHKVTVKKVKTDTNKRSRSLSIYFIVNNVPLTSQPYVTAGLWYWSNWHWQHYQVRYPTR